MLPFFLSPQRPSHSKATGQHRPWEQPGSYRSYTTNQTAWFNLEIRNSHYKVFHCTAVRTLETVWSFHFVLLGHTWAELNLRIVLPHYCSKTIQRLGLRPLELGGSPVCLVGAVSEDLPFMTFQVSLTLALGSFLKWKKYSTRYLAVLSSVNPNLTGLTSQSHLRDTPGLQLGAPPPRDHCLSWPDVQCHNNHCVTVFCSF